MGEREVGCPLAVAADALELYQAVAFPLSPGSIGDEEREVRRKVAYLAAAHDRLPLAVRMAAAEALDVMDQGQDRTAASEAIKALSQAVRECRTGYVRFNQDKAS
ncbi:hypothetical protein ACFYRN_43710 [Streptomyces sp. NPDC005227]|uniref:hypothetical protein n=1 Tax=Streptomyces sp. NPDC005227 TaxID=3364707 RepID=UPI0036873C74